MQNFNAFVVSLLLSLLVHNVHGECPFTSIMKSLTASPTETDRTEYGPQCYQSRLSATYDEDFPETTTSINNETFPNSECELQLGREYGYDDTTEQNLIEQTAIIMAERMLYKGSYDGDLACEGAGVTNCCQYKESTKNDITSFTFNEKKCPKKLSAQYEYQLPSASDLLNLTTKPDLISGDMNQRIRKQMHGESYGCIEATLKINDELATAPHGEGGLDERFRVGLLSEPGREFVVEARFSGNRNLTLDDAYDVRIRGLSLKIRDAFNSSQRIKLSSVASTAQPKIAQQMFENRDLDAFQEDGTVDLLFIAVRSAEESGGVPFNIFVDGNLQQNFDNFINGAPPAVPINQITEFHVNPLANTYGSGGAWALGKGQAAKWHIEPCEGEVDRLPKSVWKGKMSDSDFSYKSFSKTLKLNKIRQNRKPYRMCVFLQIQENPCEQPIEDASVRWTTKPVKVAELIISQDKNVKHDDLFCDSTMLHPYRTLPEHMPLGAINRVRHSVYAFANNFRTAGNQVMHNAIEWANMMGMDDQSALDYHDMMVESCFFGNCNTVY